MRRYALEFYRQHDFFPFPFARGKVPPGRLITDWLDWRVTFAFTLFPTGTYFAMKARYITSQTHAQFNRCGRSITLYHVIMGWQTSFRVARIQITLWYQKNALYRVMMEAKTQQHRRCPCMESSYADGARSRYCVITRYLRITPYSQISNSSPISKATSTITGNKKQRAEHKPALPDA